MTHPTDPPPSSDRRRAPRRKGPLTLVDVKLPGGEVCDAFILDRSQTGLRLALARSVPPGTVLRLRGRYLPDPVPWAEVAVRWTDQTEGGWEMGCQYLGELAWHARILVD